MERMKKAINEYEAMTPMGGKFTTNDLEELKQLVEAAGGKPDYYSMFYALQAGYTIGLRKGKREASNAKQSA